MKKWIKTACFLFLGVNTSIAQDDLLDMLEESAEPTTDYTIATFKSTRLVSGHSVETNAKGVMQYLIGHRFGRLNSGWRDLFGIDNATIRMGFEYGLHHFKKHMMVWLNGSFYANNQALLIFHLQLLLFQIFMLTPANGLTPIVKITSLQDLTLITRF